MTYPSNTFLHSTNSHHFTDDTIVFFGFPANDRIAENTRQFGEACEAMNVTYRELSFAQSKYWHYEKCFEIGVGSEQELDTIQPIIAMFGELNAIADADETVVVMRTRNDIQKMYAMISEVYPAHESE